MPVLFQIPDKSTLIPLTSIFTGTFNVPTVGLYDFSIPANQNVFVMTTKPGMVYFIDKYSVGGNITEGQYLESVSSFPLLTVLRRFRQSNIYRNPIPIVNYTDCGQLSNFFYSDSKKDQLLFSFNGSLRQLPTMVGLASVRIQISMDIWEISDNYFVSAFRDVLSRTMGQRNRG